MTQAATRLPSTVQGRVRAGSAHVTLVKDKVAVGEVLPEYFDFPCQYHSTIVSYHLFYTRYRYQKGKLLEPGKRSEIRSTG